jgi:hypothetical protein
VIKAVVGILNNVSYQIFAALWDPHNTHKYTEWAERTAFTLRSIRDARLRYRLSRAQGESVVERNKSMKNSKSSWVFEPATFRIVA